MEKFLEEKIVWIRKVLSYFFKSKVFLTINDFTNTKDLNLLNNLIEKMNLRKTIDHKLYQIKNFINIKNSDIKK